MRTLILTSNAIRHRYLANALTDQATDALVIPECRPSQSLGAGDRSDLIRTHLEKRRETEERFFGDRPFKSPSRPILRGEVNDDDVLRTVRVFDPEVAFVFGSSILRQPLLSLIGEGRFVNLHLGISPYYRGSGTNFWPFVNRELQFVGSTVLHIDPGVDTGDIICHVVPQFEMGDDVHSAGCKVIRDSVEVLRRVYDLVERGVALPRTQQWEPNTVRYYRRRDFSEEVLQQYHRNMANGMIEDYLRGAVDPPLIVAPERVLVG